MLSRSSRHGSPVESSPARRCALCQLQSRVRTLPSAPQSATHALTELPRHAAEPLPAACRHRRGGVPGEEGPKAIDRAGQTCLHLDEFGVALPRALVLLLLAS